MGDSLAPSSPLLVAQKPAVPLPAASPAQPAMAAPPSSIARPPAPASASLRPQNERLAPPSVAKRPKTTTPRAACYVFGESNPWMASSASRAAACSEARAASANSPFTSFAASLTPLYPNAVQAALPTPLAQLVHEGASERRGAPCDSSAPKPKRVVTFSREQLSAPANDLGSALGELSELVSQLERPEDEQHVARVDSAQQLSGGGHATHTPFAEPCLADWGREGDAPDSLARVLSIQPTQRGLSPLSADVDAECVRNHQMVHKRRLQFDCDKMLNANRAATMTPSSTPVRTPARGGATDEHWLVFREGGSLGTPLASCSPSLPMLGTPNSLKEAFRFSEGLAGWKGKGQPLATTPGGTSHAAAGEDSPLAAAPSSAAAGASAAAKAKRERGKENSSKGKPRTCNCKHSKCIKLYCDCFSAGQFCLPSCKCANCLNNADNEPAREEARRGILERNQHAFVSKVQRMRTEGAHTKGCNCKNSKCMKKYCECYQAGVSCSERCKCVDCSNGKPHVDEGEGTPAPAPAGGVEREDDCSPMELMLALRSGGVASPQCALVRAPSPRAAVLPAAPAAEAAPGALAGPVPRTKAVTALSAMLAPMAAGTSAHSTSLRAATAGPGLASPASAARAPARAAEVSAGAHAQGKPAPSCPALARAEGSTSGALMTTDALVETLADAPPRKRALGVQCEHSAAASLAAVAAK